MPKLARVLSTEDQPKLKSGDLMRMLTLPMMLLGITLAGLGLAVLFQGAAPKEQSSEAQKLRDFLGRDWKYWMETFPEMATAVGYPGQNTSWTDYSERAIDKRRQHLQQALNDLGNIDRTKLDVQEQLNYDLYRKLLETTIQGALFGYDAQPFPQVTPPSLAAPVNQMDGPQRGIADTIGLMPTEREIDYENIIARLERVPALIDQTIALMQLGMKQGITPPKIVMRDVPAQVERQILEDPWASPLLRAFTSPPASVPVSEKEQLRNRAAAAYRERVAPSFRKFHDFLVQTYIPACRENIAAASLPSGRDHYAWLVRWYTTTSLMPQQIHEIGLAEVKRIRAEMDGVIASSGFKGTFAEFTRFLRTDSQYYFTRPEDLLLHSRDISKRADPQLAFLFGKLPRLPYGVKPIPDAVAPSQTTAYYEPGSVAAGRPGYYCVNLYDLPARPKWEMEALTLHEAVPGHHLQIALSQELDLPEFRKHSGNTAFVEGWALYAESLGPEMGFFKDPYSKFGQLTYEMWRAVRLVVDTGMHSLGWSRERAIQFFTENSGKTEHDIVVEIDRYIVWPGQSLGYKIGELKIKELRAYAEKELGRERFDVRKFHDEVLAEGAVPLDVLEPRVRAWVGQQKARRP